MKKVKFSKEGNDLLNKVIEISGQVLTMCDQCGTCSGGCPMIDNLDCMPSQLNRMLQLGDLDINNLNNMWLCASCYTCTVRCPRGLDPSKICEALRLISLRKAVDHIRLQGIPEKEIKELPQIAIVSAFRKFTG